MIGGLGLAHSVTPKAERLTYMLGTPTGGGYLKRRDIVLMQDGLNLPETPLPVLWLLEEVDHLRGGINSDERVAGLPEQKASGGL